MHRHIATKVLLGLGLVAGPVAAGEGHGWHRRWAKGYPPMFEEWHRRMHAQEKAEPQGQGQAPTTPPAEPAQ